MESHPRAVHDLISKEAVLRRRSHAQQPPVHLDVPRVGVGGRDELTGKPRVEERIVVRIFIAVWKN